MRAMAQQPRWELYRLLSDSTRVRMLALASLEELAVTEFAALLRASESKVSRQASALREAGLLIGRKQGTWLLLRLAADVAKDAVVADALQAGRAVLEADGTAQRLSDIVAQRDEATREFFDRPGQNARSGPPPEMACYLAAVAPLLDAREVAIDAGTGDGALLEVLAPLYRHVVALDRSKAQLQLAERRARERGFHNVRFVCGELQGDEVRTALQDVTGKIQDPSKPASGASGADAVFASRVLHHAPVPTRAVRALVELAAPPQGNVRGGRVVIIDYASHRDEALREKQADLWLGFDAGDLSLMATEAGLDNVSCTDLPTAWCGDGPDRHLTWQVLSGTRCN